MHATTCATFTSAPDAPSSPADGDPIAFEQVEHGDELRFTTLDNGRMVVRTGTVAHTTPISVTVMITSGSLSTGQNRTAMLKRADWSAREVVLALRVPGGKFGFPLGDLVAARWNAYALPTAHTPVGNVVGHGYKPGNGAPYVRVRWIEDGQTITHDHVPAELVRMRRDENGVPRPM